MSKFIGRLADIYIGRETTRGTGVAAAFALPKSLFSLDLKTLTAPSTMGYGSIGEGNQQLVAQRWAQGAIEGDVLSKPFGLFLYALLGSCSSGSLIDSSYIHTFSLLNSNAHPSLSIYKSDEVNSELFELSMLNTLELKVKPDSLVTFNAEFWSKEPQDSKDPNAAPGAIAYVADAKFLGRHVTVKMATLTSGLAAATAMSVKSLTLKFNKNLVNNFVLGTLGPEDIINQKFEITGEIELDYDATTYKTIAKAGTYEALRIDMNNIDAQLGAVLATSSPEFLIDLSRVFIDAWEPNYPNDALVGQKFTFRALYDITNSNIINACTLRNAVVTY